MKFCIHCGARGAGAFCAECGAAQPTSRPIDPSTGTQQNGISPHESSNGPGAFPTQDQLWRCSRCGAVNFNDPTGEPVACWGCQDSAQLALSCFNCGVVLLVQRRRSNCQANIGKCPECGQGLALTSDQIASVTQPIPIAASEFPVACGQCDARRTRFIWRRKSRTIGWFGIVGALATMNGDSFFWKEAQCAQCGYTWEFTIPQVGHDYPTEI